MNNDFLIVNNYMKAHHNFFRVNEPFGFEHELEKALTFYEQIEFSSGENHKLLRGKLENRFSELLEKASMALYKMGFLQRVYRAVQDPNLLSNALSNRLTVYGRSIDKTSLGLMQAAIDLGGVPSAYSYAAKDGVDKPLNTKITSQMALALYENIKKGLGAINLEDQYYGDSSVHPLTCMVTRLVKHLLDKKQYKAVAALLIEDAEYLGGFSSGLQGLGKYAFFSQLALHNIWSHELLKEVHAQNPDVYHEVMGELTVLLGLHMASGTKERLMLEKIPFSPAFNPEFCREACKQGLLSMRLRPEEFKILSRWNKQQGGEDLAKQMARIKEVKKLVARYHHLVETVLPHLKKEPDEAVVYPESMAIASRNPVVLETLFIPEDQRLSATQARLIDAFRGVCHANHGKGQNLMDFVTKFPEAVRSPGGIKILENYMLKLENPISGKDSKGYGVAEILFNIFADKKHQQCLADMSLAGYKMLHTIVPSKDRGGFSAIHWRDPQIKRLVLERDMGL